MRGISGRILPGTVRGNFLRLQDADSRISLRFELENYSKKTGRGKLLLTWHTGLVPNLNLNFSNRGLIETDIQGNKLEHLV